MQIGLFAGPQFQNYRSGVLTCAPGDSQYASVRITQKNQFLLLKVLELSQRCTVLFLRRFTVCLGAHYVNWIDMLYIYLITKHSYNILK